MSSGKQAPEVPPAAKRLAAALRSGLELRWSIAGPPADIPNPFPPRGHVRPFLEPYANSLRFALARRRHPLHRFLRAVRYLARLIIAPWLRFQAQFNQSSVSVMEQVDHRVRALEEAEQNLRRALESLEKTSFASLDPERSAEAASLRVNQDVVRLGAVGREGPSFNGPTRVQLEHDTPRLLESSERVLDRIFVHTRLPRPPARLLALGCGDGTGVLEMASLGFDVVGVDPHSLPLRHPNFTLLSSDSAELPLEDSSFDVCVALSSLEHIGLGYRTDERASADERAVAEVFRVLKHGGRFLVTVPFGSSSESPMQRIYGRAQLDRMLHAFHVVERGYGIRQEDAWTFTLDERRAEQTDTSERVCAVCLLVLEKP
jgi:SAM-dependent methyltransferase